MKIHTYYSHLNGYEYIQHHKANLWNEIEQAIASVDADACRTKISKEKTMRGARLYSPKDLNSAMHRAFENRDWRVSKTSFWVTGDPKLIRRTLNLPPTEQKREIEEAGAQGVLSFNQTDFVKDRVAVEVQFGKYFFRGVRLICKTSFILCW